MKKVISPFKKIYLENDLASILTGIYIFTWFTQLTKRSMFFASFRFEFVLGAILVVMSLMRMLNQQNSGKNPIAKVALILIVYMSIFCIVTPHFDISWDTYLNKVIKYAFMAMFLAVFIDNISKLKCVLLFYFFAQAKAAQEGFWGWLTGNMMWQNQGVVKLHGSLDMYGHPNSFSGFAVCLLPFIFYFFPLVEKKMKIALLLLFMCASIIIIFCGSRTGYIAATFFTISIFAEALRRGALKVIVICVCIFFSAFIFMPDQYKERFESIFTQQDKEGGSINARKEIIADSIAVFQKNPFGVGINAFPYVRNEMFNRDQDTHNLYLQVLTNIGFIGLFLFLFFVYTIIKANRVIIARLKNCNDYDSRFIRALSNTIIAYVWIRIFLGIFGMDLYEIYWWYAAGLTVVAWRISEKLPMRS